MDRFSSYLHLADLDLDRPSNIPSRGNQQRPFNPSNNPERSFNQDGISSYRAELVRLANESKSNSQNPPKLPQPIGPKQTQPPAPANGIQQWSFNSWNIQQRPFNPWNTQQRPSNESNNQHPPQKPQRQPQQQAQQQPRQQPTEPQQSPFPAPPAPQAPAKEYLIITYKDSHVLVAKKPTLAELKQAAAEIFDLTLDHHKHLYAFVYRKGLDAAGDPDKLVELEIHESAYGSLKDMEYVFFAHRERKPERPDGEVGRRRGQGVVTGRDGSFGGTSGDNFARWMRLAPTVTPKQRQQGRGYGCGNSLNAHGTGQHAASHSGRRQQAFVSGGSNLNNGAVNPFKSRFPSSSSSSSSSPWWSTAVELGSHLNCGTCRQNTASRSGAGGQQQPGHGSDSNVNGVGRGNNPQPEVSSSFSETVEVNTYSLTPNQKELKAQVSRELWLVLGCQCGYWKWEDYPEVLSYKRSWEASWGRTL